MNLSLNIGDTFITQGNAAVGKSILINKSKIKIGQDSLLKLEFDFFNSNWQNLVWIESIGNISGFYPIDWTKILGFQDIAYRTNCLVKNDTNLLSEFGLSCFQNDLLNPNKKWKVWESNDNGDRKEKIELFNTGKDTLILGKRYYYMNRANTYARYDSLQKKYYCLNLWGNKEFIIFDENAQVGDTISNYQTMPISIVRSTGFKFYDNIYRKIYVTDYDTYVSGIGTIKKVFWENDIRYIPEFSNGNICFIENKEVKYHYSFYYQNKNSCDIISGINNNQYDKITIEIQNSKLYLSQIPISQFDSEIKIYNLQGQQVFQSKLKKEREQSFDLNLIKGIYILRIELNDYIISKKIEL